MLAGEPLRALTALPSGTHGLIMTQDHAEDAALRDAALRTTGLGTFGLVGSAAQWARLRIHLSSEGGHDAAAIARIKTCHRNHGDHWQGPRDDRVERRGRPAPDLRTGRTC